MRAVLADREGRRSGLGGRGHRRRLCRWARSLAIRQRRSAGYGVREQLLTIVVSATHSFAHIIMVPRGKAATKEKHG